MICVPSGDHDGSKRLELVPEISTWSPDPLTLATAMLPARPSGPWIWGTAPVSKRSFVPSGDQARLRSSKFCGGSGTFVVASSDLFDPSAFMIQMFGALEGLDGVLR